MLMRPDRAVILAAGLGTRLKWLTRDRPKALMSVAGEPAIVHTLRHLIRHGVRHVAINLHAHGEQIRQALGDGRRFGISIRYSVEYELRDSGGGVCQAQQFLPEGANLFVLNADVVTDIDLTALWQRVSDHPSAAALALIANPPHHPQGDFALVHGKVRPPEMDTLTFSGVSLWPDALLRHQHEPCFPLTDLMHQQMESDQLYGIHHHGNWHDIGRPHDLFSLLNCSDCFRFF
ncbi:MAG: sugar phosphate nucleotidyltransferase [Mariprofundales bacterium]|nr:sugar phosphate nucleotidyltransferase [Mariprofundales bacterium]